MKREVYKYLLGTYGRLPLLWLGIILEATRTVLQRIVIVIVISKVSVAIVVGDFVAAKHNIVVYVLVYGGGAILGTIGELISIRASDSKYESLLLQFYKKLVGKDLSFYRDHQTGYLASSFRQHLDGMMGLVRLWRGQIIRMAVSLVVPALVLTFADWRAGLVAFALAVAQGAYIMWASQKANVYRKPSQEVYRKLTGEVSDEVMNIVAFKSSGNEVLVQGSIGELAASEAHLFWLRHKMIVLLEVPRIFITALGVGIAYYISVVSASEGNLAIGLFVMTFTYLFQIMRNVGDLPDLIASHDEQVARVFPTLEYLGSAHETVLDPVRPKSFAITAGAIEIKNVNFGYKVKTGDVSVFNNLNLSIKGGERVGVVGLSGVGKSTLAGLLMRFDDINSGSISIDDVDIRDVRQSELRQKIAYVPQEPLLFHRSIRDNISYFKKEITDQEIIKAAEAAHAHEFIDKLPEKYDSMVGERGVKLSGGQKQRIAIARSIIKNAPIIIFDEATSALDSESEQIIQNALPTIIGKHTAIVIAHRLSTVARLDRIIVMHDGKIAEEGTHEQLLSKNGRYASLWQKQAAFNK